MDVVYLYGGRNADIGEAQTARSESCMDAIQNDR
jgi:hypothetical protein